MQRGQTPGSNQRLSPAFWGAAALLLLAFAAAKAPVNWIPVCGLRRLTGVPCPTCGAARSLRLFWAGRWGEAWLRQPLVITLVLAAAVYVVYSLLVATGRVPRVRVKSSARGSRRLWAGVLAAVFLLNWLYVLIASR